MNRVTKLQLLESDFYTHIDILLADRLVPMAAQTKLFAGWRYSRFPVWQGSSTPVPT